MAAVVPRACGQRQQQRRPSGVGPERASIGSAAAERSLVDCESEGEYLAAVSPPIALERVALRLLDGVGGISCALGADARVGSLAVEVKLVAADDALVELHPSLGKDDDVVAAPVLHEAGR